MVASLVQGIFSRSKTFLVILSVCHFSSANGALPFKTEGTLRGILTAKGQAWIEVKNDAGYSHRYLAGWLGGSPSRGGGFSPKVLGEMRDVAIGNRVELKWYWDGHLRVERLEPLLPTKKKGVLTGQVLDKGDKWIEITPTKFGTPFRYYARWIGGSPEHGGRYHEATLEFLDNLKVEDKVRLTWSYDVRPRILSFGLDSEDDEEGAFVPFYERKDLIRPSSPSSSPSNPFDSVSPSDPSSPFDRGSSSPFDQVSPNVPAGSSGSPFDALPATPPNPATNPFDAAPGSAVNPFDATPEIAPMHGNPFAPTIPGNPFDAQPANPANPFN